jgi:DNA-binding response OmpR family regulator
VIEVTGGSTGADAQLTALATGANAWLVKPFSGDELVTTVRTLLHVTA